MRNCLTILINIIFKEDLELLYGKGSIVEVNKANYCTTTKEFVIDCSLKIGDPLLFEQSQVEGLKYLIDESWKFTGMEKPMIRLITSFDVQ